MKEHEYKSWVTALVLDPAVMFLLCFWIVIAFETERSPARRIVAESPLLHAARSSAPRKESCKHSWLDRGCGQTSPMSLLAPRD
eukprot:6430824-Amphidinium_carterae.1